MSTMRFNICLANIINVMHIIKPTIFLIAYAHGRHRDLAWYLYSKSAVCSYIYLCIWTGKICFLSQTAVYALLTYNIHN